MLFGWWRLRSRLHLALLQWAYPGFTPSKPVHVDPSATIRVTDGGRLIVGARCEIGVDAMIVAEGGTIEIGDDSYIGNGAIIIARDTIRIGRDALVSQYVTIRDHDHGFAAPNLPYRQQGFVVRPVTIGDNVWLGAKATVLRGASIGRDCVVGANAVVARDLPPAIVAVGAPARAIRPIR